jgi:hypothetical protein
MCTPGKHIKLCTCNPDEIDEDRCWSITRVDPDPLADIWCGSIAFHTPDFDGAEGYLQAKILDDLNSTNVFDFEYLPQDGDVVSLSFGGFEFAFEFEDGKYNQHPPVDHGFTHRLNVAEGNIYSGNTSAVS